MEQYEFQSIYSDIAISMYVLFVYTEIYNRNIDMNKNNGKMLKLSKNELERVREKLVNKEDVKILNLAIEANEFFLRSLKFRLFSNAVEYNRGMLEAVISYLTDFTNHMRRKLTISQYSEIKSFLSATVSFAEALDADFIFSK